MSYMYDYPMQSVTASVIIMASDDTVLLIKRKDNPEKGKWCFPGGFSEATKETVEQAAAREMLEEVGLKIQEDCLRLVDVRSKPDRDPRGHIVDIGFASFILKPQKDEVKAGDDAAEIQWVHISKLREMDLAFDHNDFAEHFLDQYFDKYFEAEYL